MTISERTLETAICTLSEGKIFLIIQDNKAFVCTTGGIKSSTDSDIYLVKQVLASLNYKVKQITEWLEVATSK